MCSPSFVMAVSIISLLLFKHLVFFFGALTLCIVSDVR